MQLNKKGMTLVELIVTFALLLVIVIGLYNLILEVKFQVTDKKVIKELNEFSSITNNDIHYGLISDKPIVIGIKNSSKSEWEFYSNSGNSSGSFDGTHYVFKIAGTSGDKKAPIALDRDTCKNIFPCAVYYYTNSDKDLFYKVIALNKGNTKNTNDSLKVNGVLYGGEEAGRNITAIYEPVPHDKYIEIRDIDIVGPNGATSFTSTEDDKMYIKVKDGLFIVNFPFYMLDDDINRGFKIIYPFS